MGKTAAERQRERRPRLAADLEAYQKYLKNDRDRKKQRRWTLSEKERAKLRKRTKNYTQLWRMKQAAAKDHTLDGTRDEEDKTTPYISPDTLEKASRWVENALPKSPNKRRAVVESREYSIKSVGKH